ncbi:MAG: DNA methyltransferase [Candidatus Kaiserbacteria bacterium]|nr:DNA methyltransferase [Candidatus Kaiserbacteria bacterium]
MNTANFKTGTIWVRDNLHIMRGMNSECVDLIYLDPPFKSDVKYRGLPTDFGGDGVVKAEFDDMWKMRPQDEEWHKSLKEDDRCLYEVIEASGYSFGDDMKSYLIYMTARLFEMHRILKETGSIYLHCDHHAGHYLKIIMDCIFDKSNFRNEIIWCYTGPSNTRKWFPRKHDTILFYSKGKNSKFNKNDVTVPYKMIGIGKGDSIFSDGDDEKRVEELLKRGKVPEDWWADDHLTNVSAWRGERTGYPTQKPLKLLERIIKASSDEDDLVLDPFCGCATALIAAEKENRKWIGIDLSPVARFLIRNRMRRETNLLDTYNPISRIDPPIRTDVQKDAKETKGETRQRLYIEQDKMCNGCFWNIPLHILNDDHKTPTSHGGQDVPDNIQLLCGTCNSIKGNRDMSYLHARLKELGYMNPDYMDNVWLNKSS